MPGLLEQCQRRVLRGSMTMPHNTSVNERNQSESTSVGRSKAQLDIDAIASKVNRIGQFAIPCSLVTVLVYIGGLKFLPYEAEGISGLVSNSPLMSWAYSLLSVRGLSAAIGVSELVIAMLIALRPVSARASAIGSFMAVGMFLTTLSFLLSTPGVVESSIGFPALSALPGQFLLKDLVLLAAALWTLGNSLKALASR